MPGLLIVKSLRDIIGGVERGMSLSCYFWWSKIWTSAGVGVNLGYGRLTGIIDNAPRGGGNLGYGGEQ